MSGRANAAHIDGADIFKVLRGEILTGLHPPGRALRESDLSERFRVSRTPIREALSLLQHERLLERAPRGLQVPQIDPQQVIQVYDLRVMLEEESAGQAAQNRSTADMMRLEGLVERDFELVTPDDQTRISCNLEFHGTIASATHNRILQDMLDKLSTHLIHTPSSTLSVGNRWNEALSEHNALVEAIGGGQVKEARSIARHHMETARSIRLSLIRSAAKTW